MFEDMEMICRQVREILFTFRGAVKEPEEGNMGEGQNALLWQF